MSGRRAAPLDGAINSVACWGDTAVVRDDPSRAAVTAEGTRTTPDAEGHHWGTVCPTDPDYRAALLDRIEAVGAAGAVRLTTPGFPGVEFCRCERCERQFAASDRDDRVAWRTETITRFVRQASNRVSGNLVITLYPDPYPGNLRERTGLDPRELDSHVDGFLVPLCSISYETTYWVESLARGFARELEELDASLTIQLSASEAEVDRLVDVTRQVDPHADAVVYGTHEEDVDAIREVVRRCRTAEPPSPTV
ncbi:hypothetical protein NGM07_16190 [Halorussus vallis]|nr:hypothetical protein [Halorussus vallis]USZ74966.1 hypothetical protein NGM07_16190 [Halorussus vallis]